MIQTLNKTSSIFLHGENHIDSESYSQSFTRIRNELSLNSDFLNLTPCANNILSTIELNIQEAWKEYNNHLDSDLEFLTNSALNPIINSSWLVQESHNNQRRPILLSLDKKSYIYKPRNLDTDIAWNECIRWLGNELGSQISSEYKIIDKSNYGWCDLVLHTQCNSESDIGNYYKNLGILTAIIWVIGGRDACGTNVIASGNFPTIIDAEMILTPSHSIYSNNIFNEFKEGGLAPKKNISMNGNVLSFGAANIFGTLCIHKDSFQNEQISDNSSPLNICTLCKNIPHFNNKAFSVNGYEINLVDGFKIGINLLQNVKNKILRGTSPFQLFESTQGRVTLRPSVAYSAIKKIFINNLILHNTIIDIKEILEKLPLNLAVNTYEEKNIIAIESYDISKFDVPRFSLSFNSNTLYYNNKFICKYKFSAFERATKRLENLTQKRSQDVIEQFKKYIASAY